MLYEMRAYYPAPGKMRLLQDRFANVTIRKFKEHSMGVVGFWTVEIGDGPCLTYLLSYPDLAAREKSWNGFMADKEWIEARAASEKDGPLLARIVNQIWKPTAFSPMQ